MIGLFDSNGNLNIGLLKENIDIFYSSTGIPVKALNEYGDILYSSNTKIHFCDFIKSIDNGNNSCRKTHLHGSKQSCDLGEGFIFTCYSSLVHFAAPIVSDGNFKGSLVGGPVLLNEPDKIMVDEIMEYNNTIPSNKKEDILNYLKKIKIVTPKRLRYLNKLLFIITTNLLEEDKFTLRERKIFMDQQSRIGESIQFIKDKESPSYPYQKERELFVKVKYGDALGAKKLLNDLLGHVFFTSGGNTEVVKARILELFSVLSRAAVQGGASLDTVFGLNYKFIGKLSSINNLNDLSRWTVNLLERFTENVFNVSSSKNADIIKISLKYVNENYMKNITLNSAAQYVHLNPTYFSSLFKKEVKTGFSDYLNQVRIGEAKKYLRETDISILEISIIVGFESQSYFSKVFKKITGLTPRQYRNS
ncbi:PocR ligand-binding domain-containing protein [Haloimpatiens sp. FM7330]|uniref:PocR ligand-binding domain-containing protein n=1 Tax=Haloimpatiens sp. FM7330 TaxID=3298610 RepID=UPI00362889C9